MQVPRQEIIIDRSGRVVELVIELYRVSQYAQVAKAPVRENADRQLLDVDGLRIKGSHNLQNALAALALGHAVGLPMDDMLAALKAFSGLRHRTQFVAQIDGVDWINDSKATNVGAAIAALVGLPGKHVLIAGGIAKGADFSQLTAIVKQHCRAVVLLGQDADKIEAVMPEGMVVERVADMAAAVAIAAKLAQTGDNVLLAPACASFDMFENFAVRGEIFAREFHALAGNVESLNGN